MIDIENLKAAAQAATPGPWWSGECVPADGHALAWLGQSFVDCEGGQRNYVAPSRDADFIATANPSAILELIERLEKAEKDAARLDFITANTHPGDGWVCRPSLAGSVCLMVCLSGKTSIRDAIDAAIQEQGK